MFPKDKEEALQFYTEMDEREKIKEGQKNIKQSYESENSIVESGYRLAGL